METYTLPAVRAQPFIPRCFSRISLDDVDSQEGTLIVGTKVPTFDELTARFQALRQIPRPPPRILVPQQSSSFQEASPQIERTSRVASKCFKWGVGLGIGAMIVFTATILIYLNVIPLPHQHLIAITGAALGGASALSALTSLYLLKKHAPKESHPPHSPVSSINGSHSSESIESVDLPTVTSIEKIIPKKLIREKIQILNTRAPLEVIHRVSDLNYNPSQRTEANTRLIQAILLAEEEIAHLMFYQCITDTDCKEDISQLKNHLNILLDDSKKTSFENSIALIIRIFDKKTQRKDYDLNNDVYEAFLMCSLEIRHEIDSKTHAPYSENKLGVYNALSTVLDFYKTEVNSSPGSSFEVNETSYLSAISSATLFAVDSKTDISRYTETPNEENITNWKNIFSRWEF